MRSQELRSGVSPYMVLRASHTRASATIGTHHRPNPHVCEGPPTLNAACRCRACPLVVLAWTAAIVGGGQNCYKNFWRGNHHAPIFSIRNGKMPDESRRTKSEQSDNVKGCVLVLVRVISKDDLPDRTQNRVAERPITWPLSPAASTLPGIPR